MVNSFVLLLLIVTTIFELLEDVMLLLTGMSGNARYLQQNHLWKAKHTFICLEYSPCQRREAEI
jgi:hypothetical protein